MSKQNQANDSGEKKFSWQRFIAVTLVSLIGFKVFWCLGWPGIVDVALLITLVLWAVHFSFAPLVESLTTLILGLTAVVLIWNTYQVDQGVQRTLNNSKEMTNSTLVANREETDNILKQNQEETTRTLKANQQQTTRTLQQNLRPVLIPAVLTAGSADSYWETLATSESDIIHVNIYDHIPTHITGYVVINKKRYDLAFRSGGEVNSEDKFACPSVVMVKSNAEVDWLNHHLGLCAYFFKNNFSRETGEDNKICILYQDISKNKYYSRMANDFSIDSEGAVNSTMCP